APGAARGHDSGRHPALVEIERMIEPRLEDGRWASAILRSAEHENDVGGTCFIALALTFDTGGKDRDRNGQSSQSKRNPVPDGLFHVRYSERADNIVIRWPGSKRLPARPIP